MRTSLVFALVAISMPAAWAQSVLSAKSGTIHHVDGPATISGYDLKPNKLGEFPALEPGQRLKTDQAHAEILLTPGVFLRLGEQSQLQMVSNKLTDTRVLLLEGSALVEVDELLKGNQIMVQVGDYKATVIKAGLYRFDASPDRVRVFDGRITLTSAQESFSPVTLKSGRELSASNVSPAKFDRKNADELYAWSSQRSALVARANISAARSANASGFRSSSSQWIYQPTFGLFTYLPGNGIWASPFGYSFYSPRQVWVAFVPPSYAQSGGFGNAGGLGGRGGGGVSSTASSMGGTFGGAASAGAPARGGGSGGGGISSGGGGRR